MAQSMNKLLFCNTVFRNGGAKHTSLGGLWYSLFIFWRSQLLQYFEQMQLMAVSLTLLGTTENDKKTSSFCNLFIIWASFESMWKGHLFSNKGTHKGKGVEASHIELCTYSPLDVSKDTETCVIYLFGMFAFKDL